MTVERIFELYEKGIAHHRKHNIYDQSKKNYDFFEGRQWEGLKVSFIPPVENVIKPIVKHKYNTVSMQDIELVFTSETEGAEEYIKALNKYFAHIWESKKMYIKMWKSNKYSSIDGDNHIFIYDKECNSQLIDKTHIYFGNEYETYVQKQPYIIISERLDIEEVKKRAKRNGISDEEIDLIFPDEEIENRNDSMKYESSDKKCTSLVYLEMKEDGLHFTRCVRNLIYEPEKNTKLKLYPIASLVCNERKGHSRGIGEVEPLIPNQIEINKTLFRRSEAIKQTSFPKIAYKEGAIENPGELENAGAQIRVTQSATNVNEIISYLNPAHISNDAKIFSDELIMQTKELNNSGDGAMGNIDPTKASGAAIQALTAQANVSSNEAMANYKQYAEDIGLIFFEYFRVYNPDFKFSLENEEHQIPETVIKNIKLKIDVSPSTPYNKYAVESELKSLFTSGVISFEEFVDALDENSLLPKNKLKKIIETRNNQAENQKDLIIKKQQELLSKYQAREMTDAERNNFNFGGIKNE